MTITALADRLMSVYRRTAVVLDPVLAAASMSVDRQPYVPGLVEVTLSGGAAATGTVTVAGTVAGLPDSEVLTFTGPGVKTTRKRFEALDVPALATSGLDDEVPIPLMVASMVGVDGAPQSGPMLVVSAWPMRKDAGPPMWPTPLAGSTEAEQTRFYFDHTNVWVPRDGDVFVDDRTGEEWLVTGHPAQHGGGLREPHHYEVKVKRREGSRLA